MVTKNKEASVIKPAYKSLEGQSVAGVLLGGLYLLKDFLGGDAIKLPTPEELAAIASSAQGVAATLQAGNFAELAGTSKVGIILFFMYKIYTRFLDSRTELKKEALKHKPSNVE